MSIFSIPQSFEDTINQKTNLHYKSAQESTNAVLERVEDGNIEMFDEIIIRHIKYIISFCKKTYGSKLKSGKFNAELMDLVQEGTIGLIIAAQRFTPGKDAQFLSYATRWIKAKCDRFMYEDANPTVKVPIDSYRKALKALEVAENAKNELGENLTISELALVMGMKESFLQSKIQNLVYKTLSFDEPIGDDNKSTLQNILTDKGQLNEDTQELYNLVLKEAKINLSLREYEIFNALYVEGYKLEETLEKLGLDITRERLRQIGEKSLGIILVAFKEKYEDAHFKVDLETKRIGKDLLNTKYNDKSENVRNIAGEIYHKKEQWKKKARSQAESLLSLSHKTNKEKYRISLPQMEAIFRSLYKEDNNYTINEICDQYGLDNATFQKLKKTLYAIAVFDPRMLINNSKWCDRYPIRGERNEFFQWFLENRKQFLSWPSVEFMTDYGDFMQKININKNELFSKYKLKTNSDLNLLKESSLKDIFHIPGDK